MKRLWSMLLQARWLLTALWSPARLFSRVHDARPYQRTLEAWVEGLKLEPGARVLDLGCGPGGLCAVLESQGFVAVGMDRSEKMLAAARTRVPGGEFVLGDAMATQLPSNSFDAVLCASLLNVVSDPVAVLLEVRRTLAPHGVVGVLVPGPEHRARPRTDDSATDQALMTLWARVARKVPEARVEEWLRRAGFTSIFTTTMNDGLCSVRALKTSSATVSGC